MSYNGITKFWLEAPSALFACGNMIPNENMGLSDRFNALSRLIILMFAVLVLINCKYSVEITVICLLFLIIVYYKQMGKTTVEKFNAGQKREIFSTINNKVMEAPRPLPSMPLDTSELTTTEVGLNKNGKLVKKTFIQLPEQRFFCNDEISLDPMSNTSVGINQRLTNQLAYNNPKDEILVSCNPRVNVAPVVAPPAFDLEYWKDNNMIIHSAINSAGIQQDMYLSGYAESTCCGYLPDGSQIVPTCEGQKIPDYDNYSGMGASSREGFCGGGIVSPTPTEDISRYPRLRTGSVENFQGHVPIPPNTRKECRQGGIVAPTPIQNVPRYPRLRTASVENFDGHVPIPPNTRKECRQGGIVAPTPIQNVPRYPRLRTASVENYESPSDVKVMRPNEVGWMNTACGYNPEQLEVGLPSNLPVGNCQQSPLMKRYNENMFTEIVTPGVYTTTQINEPINSNIGISFQQQFEPLTSYRDDKGLHYVQHDPRVMEPVYEEPESDYDINAKYDNVYDPRFYGYGTSYRSYIDPTTGQPRFMYDDVNAIRMPTYITRSKVDFLPFADTYGPLPEGGEFGNAHNPNIRQLAQDAWMRDSLTFRNDITERAMRKINAQAWQKRMAPLGAKMVGSSVRQKS